MNSVRDRIRHLAQVEHRTVRLRLCLAAVCALAGWTALQRVAAAQGLDLLESSDEELVATRAPLPDSTPGPLAQRIADAAVSSGVAEETMLGQSVDVWVNVLISIGIVILGFVLGQWLLRASLHWIAKQTPTSLDDKLLHAVGVQLRRLVIVVALHLATVRLTVLNATTKRILVDVYFVAGLYLVVMVLWRGIDVGENWYRERVDNEQRLEEADPAIVLATRTGRVVLVVLGLTTLLAHFGVNVPALAAALGLSGLALSLAAKDTIADAIAGVIILFDRPFRAGDRIEIEKIDTWGDVIQIGLRTTRIRTRDNRLVIVPNSLIGSNQIVNYSYPDPRYRIQVHVNIGYGSDIDEVCQVLERAVRQVDGVLPDLPVEALYLEMGPSSMVIRVRWWIGSYEDTRRMFHRVNRSLQRAIEEHGIDQPFPTTTTQLQVNQESIATVKDIAP